jgi:hypothetical protein
MKTQEILRSIALMMVASLTPVFAAGPGASNDFGGKRVLIIGIDGLRPDALALANTPHLDALAAQGVLTYQAYAGGELGTVTEQPTWSGPGWTSVTTGVWTNKHKVVDNTFAGYKKNVAASYPHFFKRLKDLRPNAYVSSIVDWTPIDSQIVDKIASSVNYRAIGTGATYALQDADVKNKAVAHLGSANPDVAFVYFVNVDETGHSSGFSPANPAYISAIETTDTHIGAILAAINARPQVAQEKWLYVMTSDHGGSNGHGGQSSEHRTIPMLVSGGSVNAPHVSDDTPPQLAVPPTVMKYLGLPIDPAWGWENAGFGLPPYFFGTASQGSAELAWVLPTGGLAGLTGYEIRRNGAVIASVPVSITGYTDTPAPGTHAYEIRFLGTSEVRKKTIEVAGNLNDQLVLHLPFDGSVQDSSGRGNHGTVNGAPNFTAGKNGQCLQFSDPASPHQYVTLGQPADLQFGSATSFTVSVWVNHSGTFADNRGIGGSANDPAILSNKDWNAGLNTGWVISAGGDGRWQWNIGDSVDRADYDSPASTLSDGLWHHLCVVHNRATNEARLFYDGSLVATRSLSAIGNVDAAKPTAVATDGTHGAVWPSWFDGKIDEVKIWRRALLNTEVQSVFQQ